jgi:hypothetical protein
LISAGPVLAQGQPAAQTPTTGMAAHGSVDLGYRFQDVVGNADTFRQLWNLSDGPRVFGVDLRATGGSAPTRAFDTLTLSATGLGGDPFPSVLLKANRLRVYELRASWRRSTFFNVAPLTPPSIDGFDTQAVTDAHAWDTIWNITNVAVTAHPAPHLQLHATYDRVARDGGIGSTRSIDFVGAPSTWGAFARANPYPVAGVVDDVANRLTAGFSYGRDRWTLHYEAGYQSYDERLTLDPLASAERSINVSDPNTARELLRTVNWQQTRDLATLTSNLSFVVRPKPPIEWRGEYWYYRAKGPFSLDAAFAGDARTTSATVTSPYQVTIGATGEGEAPSHVVGQGFSYRPSWRWTLDFDYRYSQTDGESSGRLTSLLTGYSSAPDPSSTVESEATAWDQSWHALRVSAFLQPLEHLTVRPGIWFSHRDIVVEENGTVHPATSRDDGTVMPEVSAVYRPFRWLTARGSLRSSSNDSAYTRMSPSDRTLGHLGITITPTETLTIMAAVDGMTAKLPEASYEARTRGGSIGASYAFNDRVTAYGSFDYRSLLFLGDTTFLRGTAPITDVVMRDREVDNVWQGGAMIRVLPRLEVTASGNYTRVRGTDSITGEPPLYGPMTFPFGTVSISYDIPRTGKVSLDIQRMHYFQDLLPLNDVRASLVTLRFTRAF